MKRGGREEMIGMERENRKGQRAREKSKGKEFEYLTRALERITGEYET